MDMTWFWTWLKQPSSLRALNLALGLIGIVVAPELWEGIVAAMGAIWFVIDGLYNRQPKEPE